MSSAALQAAASSTFTQAVLFSRARSPTRIPVRSTNRLALTGIFPEASPVCLGRTFQPALNCSLRQCYSPSLPNCKSLTSLAQAGWQAGLDLLAA